MAAVSEGPARQVRRATFDDPSLPSGATSVPLRARRMPWKASLQ
ncbi:hypothetical protein THTE_1519 [Thermogutta terrifontis]|uniref:Uncharacterized protein n=1 Tax=Thermogutta terrifontis TaxID=1331910 RepID=A0A286RDT2_9BACT|nr:hypothetical protein THTE_1519 [Thermogutta terrifontis]